MEVSIRLLADDLGEVDGDCYTDEDVAAFGDSWWYVGVRVEIEEVRDGQTRCYASGGLWGVEYGPAHFEGNEAYIRSIAAEEYAELCAAFPELPAHPDQLMWAIKESA